MGLLLFGGALVVMALKSFKLIVWRGDEEICGLARLVLGLTLAAMAAGFFEVKLASPSNIAVFMLVASSVILTRLESIVRDGSFAAGYEYDVLPSDSYAHSYYEGVAENRSYSC